MSGEQDFGGQDLGGTHGHGQVKPEANEPVFHADWEKRAFALTLAMARPAGWNIDMSRFARENRPSGEYLSMSYYQLWFAALETMLKERDLVSDDEIVVGHALRPPKLVKRVLSPDDVLKVLHRGGPTERDTSTKAAFKPGDTVRARTIDPPTHTRLPRYVRGRQGTIERVIGCHVFPDSNANGAGENPQWLYTVRFDGRELWGAGGDPTVTVSIDAWEPYLEPA
jgi:nitrile hydratase